MVLMEKEGMVGWRKRNRDEKIVRTVLYVSLPANKKRRLPSFKKE